MKHVKAVFKYPNDKQIEGGHNPCHAEVALTAPVTEELTFIIKDVEGVDSCCKGASFGHRYQFWFSYGAAFDRHQIANNVRMAIAEYFGGLEG